MSSSEDPGISVLYVSGERDAPHITFLRDYDGFDVTTAVSVSEALGVLDEGETDCVVSEQYLPDSSGILLLQAVRVQYPDLPFMLLVEEQDDTVRRAITARVTDCLPIRTPKIGDTLAVLIENAVEYCRARRTLGNRAETVLDPMVDSVCVVRDGDVVYANPSIAGTMGVDRPEALVGKPLSGYFEEAESTNRVLSSVQNGETRIDSLGRRIPVNSGYIDVEVDIVRVLWGGEPSVLVVVHDITRRVAVEERLEEILRVNEVVGRVTDVILNAEKREELEEGVCEYLADPDTYLFAWIGEYDEEKGRVNVRSFAGHHDGYLDDAEITVGDEPTGRGPTGRAVTTKEIQICQEIRQNPEYEPWRSSALERGYESSAAVPLVYEGELYGVLNLYAGRPRAFDDDEVRLLEELAENIAFALYSFESRAALRRTERRLSVALDAANAGVLDWNLSESVVSCDEGMARLLGLGEEPTDVRVSELLSYVHPDYGDSLVERVEGANPGDRVGVVIRAGNDEDMRWLSVEGEVVETEDGEPARFLGVCTDITRSVERQHELEERVKEMRFVQAITQALEVTEVELKDLLSDIVDEVPTAFQYPEATEARLRYDGHLFTTDGFEPCEDFLEYAEETDSGYVVSLEVAYTETKPEEDHGPFLTEEKRMVETAVSLVGNYIDRLHYLEDLRESEERMSLALDVSEAGIWDWNPETDELFWDENLRRIFGEAADSEVGYERFLESIHPDDRDEVAEQVERSVETDVPFETEFRVVHNGGVRWVSSKGKVISDGEESVRFLGASLDVTERKVRQQHMVVMDRVLRHNLRNDLSVVRGYAETISESVDGETKELARGIIEKSDDLLKKADKERMILDALISEPTYHETDVVKVVRGVVEEFRDRYPDVAIQAELEGEATVTVTDLFRNAVSELVNNAVVHNDSETPEVTVSVEDTDDGVRISVSDNGPRIPEMNVKVLTDEYETPLYHGSGLGLWLVYWVVLELNGTLSFGENEPRGNVVEITLPKVKL
ncbi:MAG: GAF domain-containing protein [Halobacteriales archaeon]